MRIYTEKDLHEERNMGRLEGAVWAIAVAFVLYAWRVGL
jgi:hypothetical protein